MKDFFIRTLKGIAIILILVFIVGLIFGSFAFTIISFRDGNCLQGTLGAIVLITIVGAILGQTIIDL